MAPESQEGIWNELKCSAWRGVDADLDSVAIVRRELPPLLADTPLENIYNFDETSD